MNWAAVWGDTWRIGLTLLGMAALVGVWALILPHLSPFGNRPFTPSQVEEEARRSAPYKKLQNWSVRLDVFFFIYLVVEGAILVPYLFIVYGLR
jgi:hypothetical protein